jgi:hypothetical protein
MNVYLFRRVICAAILMNLAMTAGCSSYGTLLTRHRPTEQARLIDVPADGTYGLYFVGGTDPILQFEMKQSEKIGFEFSQAEVVGDIKLQQIYAVAGDRRFPLDVTRSYEWRKQ